MQSLKSSNFSKNLSSVLLPGQGVLTGQSLTHPDNVGPGAGPGVFKTLNHCLLLKLSSLSIAPATGGSFSPKSSSLAPVVSWACEGPP
jgi:hypothetical protein